MDRRHSIAATIRTEEAGIRFQGSEKQNGFPRREAVLFVGGGRLSAGISLAILGAMKKIAAVAAVFVLILLLTKIANQTPPDPPSGYTFWMYAQHVVECTPGDITLVDVHQTETHLDKDQSWPGCSTFQKSEVLDFHLSRGEKTKFLSDEKTAWWR